MLTLPRWVLTLPRCMLTLPRWVLTLPRCMLTLPSCMLTLLRWAGHARRWRALRDNGVSRLGEACLAVSVRIGQPLTPDMNPDMQVRVADERRRESL
jgi:hypothetical protein